MADAEIIAVGSELLTPQRLDTNSLYLTDQLNALGVEVVRKTVVGDERVRRWPAHWAARWFFNRIFAIALRRGCATSAARWRRSTGGRLTSSKARRCCRTSAAPRPDSGSPITAWASCCCPARPWK